MDVPDPSAEDRRELPPCPSCTGTKVLRLPETAPASQLRWFRCLKCSHIWKKGPRRKP
jgi:hypothetical protein